MLTGPYPINDVDLYVTRTSPGIYILSRDGRTAAYVGRSDTDVASRIKQSSSEGYAYFWFEHATSPRDAYYKECEYYHKYNPPDNTNHPAVPSGTYWRCPIIGCPWS
ncbi:MAG: hypothetical protein COT45_03235 [bacterium (Candidatus Stahlbacteria) CG08_land_8_20_14_0_20_40_26]|nr:MAG: hypothetical protein COX49_05450 [bacterium (Candidatus Stahlbacteria) CG23_combo_of_CG06-09_8_20_14_all_40_9]PIS24983.1 MAG: hypothetical protein COT45_03235 [bacterium (Candidatus Stahlbacteria) CG08_land_8_20_14_0_20_40_26]